MTFCRQQCGGNQKSPSYQSEVHDNGCHASCLGYFLASVKMLHCVTRRLACHPSYELLSPTAPSKEAVKCLTSYSLYINVMTSSKIPKVCSNKKFKYSGSAISLSLLCAGILFGRIQYLPSQPTHGVNKILWGINFENQKVHHIIKGVHEMVQGFTG